MTEFICIAALIGVAAALMLTRSTWWPALTGNRSAVARAVDLLAQQLTQLDALHATGALSAEQHASAKAVVERKLLDALSPAAPATPASSERPSRALSAALVAFMFAVAGGGYALIGSPRNLAVSPDADLVRADPQQPDGAAQTPHELTAEQISGMTDRLAARLATHPEDADGWTMLARSYEALEKHAEAVAAFARAEHLRPDDPNLLADYADALAMQQEHHLEGEPTALIRRALAIDPNNNKALALAGTAAFDRHDYKEAVSDWETLARVEPPDGPFASQVQGGIAEARRLAGMASPVAATAAADVRGASAPASEEARAAVTGTVTLAPTLQGRVSPDDVLFVFARPAGGGRMPLAILRKRAGDLPLRFTLDDSLAMSPTATLSGASKVIVGARISKSGNAMPQGGDLEGKTQVVAVGATGLKVEIDQEVAR